MNYIPSMYLSTARRVVVASLLSVMLASAFLLVGFNNPTGATKKDKKYSDTTLEIKFTDDSDITVKGNAFTGTGADEVNEILGRGRKFSKTNRFLAKKRKS